MATGTAATAAGAFIATAVIVPRAEVVVHMPQGEEQGNRQDCSYHISCHKDSSNQKPRRLRRQQTLRKNRNYFNFRRKHTKNYKQSWIESTTVQRSHFLIRRDAEEN